MNTITKISTAIALGLSLMGASVAADAAAAHPAVKAEQLQSGGVSYPRGRVIQLGTITVTRADVEGARKASHQDGTVFLGSINVTPADSADARYAQSLAQRPGTVYLGTVQVTARNHKLPVIGALLAAIDSVGSRNLLTVVGALVFSRMAG
jgi:hypothetical protein